MVKGIFSFDIFADTRCKTPRWKVKWVGQWDYHIMDWSGCNYQWINAKNQPKFTSYWEALKWAQKEYGRLEKKAGGYRFFVDGAGTNIGPRNEHDPREISETDSRIKNGREFTQEEWDNLREEYRDWRKGGGY